ncbi:hypothetical protein E3E26_05725 [Thermococcus sp. LS1]|uniref:hypothetical protein n=1 Tax=Thermococcus sp. LS1 TaxID=1638259 RepID=UPI00143AB8D9|nr:hypothetical protein [Thermococcus sp. LS1]NJD99281.1 hypothetical protein [Thermococcus sp. LS1]
MGRVMTSNHCQECENCAFTTRALVWLARQSNTFQYLIKIAIYFIFFWGLGVLLIMILHHNTTFSEKMPYTHVNPIYFGFVGAIWEALKIFVYNSISMPPTFMPKTNSVLIVLTSKSIPRSKNIIDLSLCDYPGRNVFIHEFKNKDSPVKSVECLMEFIRTFIETKLTVNLAYYKLYNTAFAFIIGRMMYLRGYDHKVYHRWGCIFSSRYKDQEHKKSRKFDEIVSVLNRSFLISLEVLKANNGEISSEKIPIGKFLSIQDILQEIIDFINNTGGYSEKTMILLDSTMTELSREALCKLIDSDVIEKVIILRAKVKDSRYRDKLYSHEVSAIAILFEQVLDEVYRTYSTMSTPDFSINIAFKTPSAIAHYIGYNASHVNYKVFMFDVDSGEYTNVYKIKGNNIIPDDI